MLRECIFGTLTFFSVSTTAAMAADVTPAQIKVQDTLKTFVTNMGYTTTYAADKSHFYFDISGKYDYHLDITASADGTLIYVYDYIGPLTPTQLTKVPYRKILEFQNISNVFFTMDASGKSEDLYVQEVFGASGITLADFREEFDHFRNALDETDSLWNPKLWK